MDDYKSMYCRLYTAKILKIWDQYNYHSDFENHSYMSNSKVER